MVTEDGWGMRVPLSHKRLWMVKRGRAGLRVMRVADGDDMVGACIVSGKTELKKPAEPRQPFWIWYSENKATVEQDVQSLTDEKRAQMEGEIQKVDAEEADADDKGVPLSLGLVQRMGRKRYGELCETDTQGFEKRAVEEKEKHEELMETFRQHQPESEQVMVASQNGFISRIMVESVPVFDKRGPVKGVRVCRIKGRDSLSSISLLSAADDSIDGVDDAPPAASPVIAAATEPDSPELILGTKGSPMALPTTPPINHHQATPMQSPGRRISGKRSVSDMGVK